MWDYPPFHQARHRNRRSGGAGVQKNRLGSPLVSGRTVPFTRATRPRTPILAASAVAVFAAGSAGADRVDCIQTGAVAVPLLPGDELVCLCTAPLIPGGCGVLAICASYPPAVTPTANRTAKLLARLAQLLRHPRGHRRGGQLMRASRACGRPFTPTAARRVPVVGESGSGSRNSANGSSGRTI